MERSAPSPKWNRFQRTPIHLHWLECLAPVFLRRETCGCWKPRLNVGGLQVHDPHFVFMVHILYSWSTFRIHDPHFCAHDPHFEHMIHILCPWSTLNVHESVNINLGQVCFKRPPWRRISSWWWKLDLNQKQLLVNTRCAMFSFVIGHILVDCKTM